MDVTTAVPLCQLMDIPADGAIAAETPAGEDLIVCRRGDTVFCYINRCPHAGRRLDWAPGQFLLKNDTLICAVHGASFAVADGLCRAGPCRGESLRAVPTHVAGAAVWLTV